MTFYCLKKVFALTGAFLLFAGGLTGCSPTGKNSNNLLATTDTLASKTKGFTSKHYSGKTLPDSETVTFVLINNGTWITKIDDREARPNAGKSFLPFGGGYFTLARSIGITKVKVLPGKHTLTIWYNDPLYAQKKSERGALIEFTAIAGHIYAADSILSDCTTLWCNWEPFIMDLTEQQKVDGLFSILPESGDPARPLMVEMPK